MSYFIFYNPEAVPDKAESFREIRQHRKAGEVKVVTLKYNEVGGTNCFEAEEYWTNLSSRELGTMGYKKCTGWFESLKYTGVPCYMRLRGFNEAEPMDLETAESERRMLESKAINKFKGGFKTSMSPLQVKQMVAIVPIALGGVLGLFLLFGGGF